MAIIKEIKIEKYKGSFNLEIVFSDNKYQRVSIEPDSCQKKVARSLNILA